MIKAEKVIIFRPESKKKSVITCFDLDMGNIDLR
jgi:hypothetical protein